MVGIHAESPRIFQYGICAGFGFSLSPRQTVCACGACVRVGRGRTDARGGGEESSRGQAVAGCCIHVICNDKRNIIRVQ